MIYSNYLKGKNSSPFEKKRKEIPEPGSPGDIHRKISFLVKPEQEKKKIPLNFSTDGQVTLSGSRAVEK